jgi:hypothetical protein
MLRGEVLAQFVALLLEQYGGVLDLDQRLQDALRLQAQVERTAALTIVVVRRLGAVDLCLERGQLGFEELQRLLGFGRTPLDVLANIGIHDVVENSRSAPDPDPTRLSSRTPDFLPRSLTE